MCKENKNSVLDKNVLNVFTYGYLPWRYIGNWFGNVRQFFRNCKYAWQRIKKGYCDQDVWNFDYYMTVMIANGLKELSETRHSYPADMTDEEWGKVLEEISQHLLNSLEDNIDTEVSKKSDALWEEKEKYVLSTYFEECEEKGYSRMKQTYSDEEKYKKLEQQWFEAEKEAAEWRKEQKDKALDLLKKYWYSCWD